MLRHLASALSRRIPAQSNQKLSAFGSLLSKRSKSTLANTTVDVHSVLPASLLSSAKATGQLLSSKHAYSTEALVADEDIEHQAETKITTISTGLRVATECTGGETVTVSLWIDAGSRFETPETNGTAHFLEHMAFKGTSSRTQNGLEIEIENMGGHLNAYTSRETTVYYAKVQKQDVEKAMNILADILQQSTLPPNQIERERSVILREMEEVNSNMEEVVFDHLHETAFGDSPLAATILGPVQNIQSITRTMLKDYITKNYVAPRIALVAVGGVDHADIVAQAERQLTVFPRDDNVVKLTKPKFLSRDMHTIDDKQDLAHVGIGFEGSAWSNPDFFELMIAATIVGNWNRAFGHGANVTSQLAKNLGTRGLAHSYMAFHTCYNDTGLWGVYITADRDTLPQAVVEVQREVVRLCEEVTEEEVEAAKLKYKTQTLMSLENTTAISEEIGRQLLSLGRRMTPAETVARIGAVTAQSVKEAMHKYVYEKDPAVVGIGQVHYLPKASSLRASPSFLPPAV
ncbi:hypothetical protein SARC_06359 [Sphaeroforma arctica JP610]|uniref:Mitochondrial-processing peptidase subunit beta n=1 Tax=Sphaeroforma arctica JP610 TaxID=667725 RepID=A0A0L0FXD6_9EUKA|nr:hypothetical protein SARC_06359 [Sphaeroforma arctica JP610]KNC81309.1 hypothetical protein SARC_06359 [Sphaeroforma arctica JP610]|eukprot:XP_014155211.1 hypothetical protein SARC_06359 [Sphaeroforma arctica JP610]